MNSKIILLLVAFFIYPGPIHAQDINPCSFDSLNDQLQEPFLTGDVFQILQIGKGTQFFKSGWLSGDIQLVNNAVAHNKNLNYNGFVDELIYLESDSFIKVKIDKELVSGFCLKDKQLDTVYRFTRIKVKKELSADSSLIYAQILYMNKLSLFAYRQVLLDVPVRISTQTKDYNQAVYKPSTVYYFRLTSGKTISFKKISKATILALFPENSDLLKKILKEKKQRKFKKESDLIRITEIFNSVALY